MKNFTRKLISVLMLLMMMFVFIDTESFAKKDTFVIGMEANYAPFNWSQSTDENGAYPIENSKGEYANGYDVQIAKKIADSLGKKLVVVKMEWDGLAPAVMSGKVDAIIAGMSPTKERKEQIDFSDTYYSSDLVIVTKKDSKYIKAKSLNDLKDFKITGQLNTFHYTVIDQIKDCDKLPAMESFPSMLSAVLAEKIDGYVAEKPQALSAEASNAELSYIEFEKGSGFETSAEDTSIAIGVKKNSDLTEKINEALKKISPEERDKLMQEMVRLNVEKDQPQGFLSKVKSIFNEYGSLFLNGALMTLFIASVSTIIGFLIGILVAVIRNMKLDKDKNKFTYYLHKVINFILACYVEIFRGTPMMVQSMLIYFGAKLYLGIDMAPISAALFIVSVNTGAYLSEVVRGGINSVDVGQMEACKALGMTHGQSMINVILPQAIKNILPSIGNEFVINIKDTSVLNVISVTELFFVSKSIAGSTYNIFETYAVTCIIYFVLTFSLTRLLLFIEKKSNNREYVMEATTGGMFNGK
ncbi:ABC transporter permease subunit [Finegoldia sp. BIOML-A2]|uniref:Inner membrane amino-acid ABC transporter permease protein YecS n=1 Tax=Finegoldia magna TaxID=1260 RepID=A0A6N2ZDX0_FINMA|nr:MULTISPECIES: ABC transporter permease subunit [unclassified Finegoldia]MSA96430.1 ABC transporter permease subunit [Finegoldia sp. BIOML-A5]MSA99814.1 ABC transporter permease subunit [Finegoldia sp. BIOML-A2]